MGSNQQLQNHPIPEDFAQFLNTVILSQNDASSTLGDLSHSVVQMPQQDTLLVPRDTSISPQNNATNSRSSTDESSMLTVADSPFSGGSYMPINGSNSTVSRTSNCGKLSGHPSKDQFPALQQTFQEGQTYPSCCARQGEQLPNLPITPQLMTPAYQASAPLIKFKKPRLEMQQENTMHAYSQQQLSPSQVPMQLNSHDLMASTKLFYQNLSRYELQNQTPVPAFSPVRRQVQCFPPYQTSVTAKKKLAGITEMNGALCFRRLLHYMQDLRNRPADNNIDFLRKFVHHYFSPGVRRRWCLSNYCNVGSHVHNISSQTTADSWKCDFCGSKLEKGFEATYAVLPRMIQVYFESVVDEILYLDSPVEKTLPSGCMVLWFGKAVQESIYKHFLVVHEGQLRIVFTPELKILSWDFCIQRHEELVLRRSIITQVNYMVDEVTKLQNNSEGVTAQDVQSNCNRVMDNLVTKMIPFTVDEVGFPKRFVRHLQMSDTLHCMKHLMTETRAKNLGPIETLRSYSQETAVAKSKHVEGVSQMHGTSSVANIVTQTASNAGEQQAMLSPLVYYPDQPVMEEQRMSSNSISSMKNLYVPSTSQQLPTVGRQIDDLLACMRPDGFGAGKCKSKPGGKRRLVYVPKNVEHLQFVEFADKAKSKGFNYSSSSNSSAMVKREPESDGDSTSPA